MAGWRPHVVGHGRELLGAHGQARLFQRLALGAGKEALAHLEVSTWKLPLAYVSMVSKGHVL